MSGGDPMTAGARDMVIVDSIQQTCWACPSQWEGRTRDGRWVYVRYRWGGLQVGFGDTLDDAVGDHTISERTGDDMAGLLSYDELIAATRGRVSWPCDPAESR